MGAFAALDVLKKETAICLVDQGGTILAETKVSTCPEAITDWLAERCDELERVGMETGPSCGMALECAGRAAGADRLPRCVTR